MNFQYFSFQFGLKLIFKDKFTTHLQSFCIFLMIQIKILRPALIFFLPGHQDRRLQR